MFVGNSLFSYRYLTKKTTYILLKILIAAWFTSYEKYLALLRFLLLKHFFKYFPSQQNKL